MQLDFIKMNGAGNDFIIFDARNKEISLSEQQILSLSSRDNSVTKGCDQLLILRRSDKADVFMEIYNSDSGEVDACGNATRCIAVLLEEELKKPKVSIATNAGILIGHRKTNIPGGKQTILVDMGAPKFEWQEIPLAMCPIEAAKKIEEFSGLKNPAFINMGNPHVVFFMNELPSDAEVARIGSSIENFTEIFPERVNVSFVTKISNLIVHAKVWERGAGLTATCGTGACAIQAAANKLDNEVTNLSVFFKNSGQFLVTQLQSDGHILLSGETQKEFSSTVEI